MKRAVLESPFAGNVERNIAYAKLCVRDMLKRGEAPIASHLLFTQPGILNDGDAEERKLGIAAGHAWLTVADIVVFYVDFGMSRGMIQSMEQSDNFKEFEVRRLPTEQIQTLYELYPEKT
jgi:hypothetical protein